MVSTRRSFLAGLGAALVAAPAIVRASSIMPVKALPPDAALQALLDQRLADAEAAFHRAVAETLFNDHNADFGLARLASRLDEITGINREIEIIPGAKAKFVRWLDPVSAK